MANESRGSVFVLKIYILMIIFHVSSGLSLPMDPNKDVNSSREEIRDSTSKSALNHFEEVYTSPEIDSR